MGGSKRRRARNRDAGVSKREADLPLDIISIMGGSKRRCARNGDAGVSKREVDLPLDIILDILSRLPVESIMRCGSVCKTWYAFTQDPHFIKLQLSRTNNQPARLILQPSGMDTDYYLNGLVLLDSEECKARKVAIQEMNCTAHHIMCCCNGLVCIAAENMLNPVFICNPITEECVTLPPSKSKIEDILSHNVALGFDSSSGKYKVVRAYKFLNKHEVTRFEIITLGENKWRKLIFPRSIRECKIWRSVFWNGNLYWRISRKAGRQGRESILAFGLSDEKFQMISIPASIGARHLDLQLLVLDNCLTLVEHESHMMHIWKVTGNMVEGFSLSPQQTYDTYVRWGGCFCYAVMLRSNPNRYLLQVSAMYQKGKVKSHFVHFSPDMAQYFPLDITGLPEQFKTLCFNPSLVSPKAALLGF
ncbi:hypothetical protein L1049_028138 [Liquidambar formosana]|uniref:F-box domain-containing protein n=1 Tax=Liquidambar formosana TaxID=63359 RepID=A0AAP0RM16_LIQFO